MTDETVNAEAPKARAKPLRARTDGPSAELAKRRAERKARGVNDHSNDSA
jgi:hypothetical protein